MPENSGNIEKSTTCKENRNITFIYIYKKKKLKKRETERLWEQIVVKDKIAIKVHKIYSKK